MKFDDFYALLPDDSLRRGVAWERICRWFLLTEPLYAAQIKKAWLWNEWPDKWGPDTGIDLVAEAVDGGLWAIQAKAYNSRNSVRKSDIDSFLSESSRSCFTYRLLIATTNNVSRNALRVIKAQEKPTGRVLLTDLQHAQVTWPTSITSIGSSPPPQKTPRPHQEEAIDTVLSKFQEGHRKGQVIMACGTGKTLVSLWLHERTRSTRTLVLAPSLSLLRQTITEWLAAASTPFEFLPVCSDTTVSNTDAVVAHVADLGFPATGSAQEVAEFLARPGSRVVFSTYQSSPVVAEALRSAPPLNLTIADEAHRCTGRTSGAFTTVLDNEKIPTSKLIFQTATPRHYTDRVTGKAEDLEFEMASMDNPTHFGAVLHRLSFGEAINRGLLCDYRVIVVGIDDEECKRYAESGALVTLDGETTYDARTLASQIGLGKAIKKYDLRRILTFHGRVKNAREFAIALPEVIAWMPMPDRPEGKIWSEVVSGTMSAGHRAQRLDRLRLLQSGERGVLTNARCLSEGVDIPTLDAIAFVDPRRSTVDIAQAVGRAIRRSPNKDVGTIVIPVFIRSTDDPEQALDDSAFEPVWSVVRALREHDDDLAEILDEIRSSLGRRSPKPINLPRKIEVLLPRRLGLDFARAFRVRLVQCTSSGWHEWYGRLQSYASTYGDSAPALSYRCPDNHRLGGWVSKQREAKKAGALSDDRSAKLERLPGWVWDTKEAAWEAALSALRAYAEREGDCRVPQRHQDESGLRLGLWVGTQRQQHSKGKLHSDRVAALEALPGWSWDLKAEAWQEGYDHVRDFIAREGHANVPTFHVEPDGFNLGQWVATRRGKYRSGKMSKKRAKLLENLQGWSWSAFSTGWEEKYSTLLAYARSEGHCRVPAGYTTPDGFELGSWVLNQRQRHKSGDLSSERASRLEQIDGWTWDAVSSAWEVGYSRLLAFAERNGSARVPATHTEPGGLSLGAWVSRQRSLYRKGTLSLERQTRLEAVGDWTWDPHSTDWEIGYAYLLEFSRTEGHSRVPDKYQNSDGFGLGEWALTQRKAMRKGELTHARKDRLEQIQDWTWDVNDAKWENAFERLLSYVSREGSPNVPSTHREEDGFHLGAWVARQRRRHQSNSLPDHLVNRLQRLRGWEWDPRTRAWEEGLSRFIKYVERRGSWRIKAKYCDPDGYPLGKWVTEQRRMYHLGKLPPEERKRKRTGQLSSDQIRRLEQTEGWVWDAQTAAWEEGFNHLLAFAMREGHTRVPRSYDMDGRYKLGQWVSVQRKDKRQGKMLPERAQRLEELPKWTWDTRERRGD